MAPCTCTEPSLRIPCWGLGELTGSRDSLPLLEDARSSALGICCAPSMPCAAGLARL